MTNEKSSGRPTHEESAAQGGSAVSKERRDTLKKTITVGGVSVALTGWTKPVVESVVLPAHAQTTGGFAVGFVLNL